MVDSLAQRIQKENAYREASLQAATEIDKSKWNKRVEDEIRKKEDTFKEIEEHRLKILRENEELRVRHAEEAKEELKRLQELDEKNRFEDEKRKIQNRQKGRELAQIYLEEMVINQNFMLIYYLLFRSGTKMRK